MKIKFSVTDNNINNNTYLSDVFAVAELPTQIKTSKFLGWTLIKVRNRLNYLVLIPDGDLFVLSWIDESKIVKVEEGSEPTDWLFLVKHVDQIPYYSKIKLKNLKCYEWMIKNQGFFINIYDNNDSTRNLLYKNIPGLLSKKHEAKYSKQLFYDNINYLVSYDDEPEVDLLTKNGKTCFVIAYKNSCDFYDEANNYHKLSKIEEIENFISFDDIVDIQGDFVDFNRDVREQSNVVDGKLLFKVISK